MQRIPVSVDGSLPKMLWRPVTGGDLEAESGKARGTRLKVLLVDDHVAIRRGLRAILEARPDLIICGEAPSGEEGVRLAHDLHPDLVLMDIAMPGMTGLEATRQILRDRPDTQILILSLHKLPESAHQVGARGYVLKSDAETDLLRAIAALERKETYFSPSVKPPVA